MVTAEKQVTRTAGIPCGSTLSFASVVPALALLPRSRPPHGRALDPGDGLALSGRIRAFCQRQ